MWAVDRAHGNVFAKVPKLGPALTSSLPPPPKQTPGPPLEVDVGEDQNLNAKYVYSGTQREFIRNGRSEENLVENENILRKRDLLPNRIQDLIDDVVVLSASPYISESDWESGQVERKQTRSGYAELHRKLRQSDKGLDDIDTEEISEQEINYYDSPFDSPTELWDEIVDITERSQQIRDDVFVHSTSSKEFLFGFEIGSLLQMLRGSSEDDPIGVELIWGFILAFIGDRHTNIDQERENLDDLIEELDRRHDSRKREADQMPQNWQNIRPEFTAATEEAIEEVGLNANQVLVREILYHQRPFPDSKAVHKKSVKNMISDLVDIVPLNEVSEIDDIVSNDLQQIQDKNPGGIESVPQVLKTMWQTLGASDTVSEDTESQNEHSTNRSPPAYRRQTLAEIVDAGDWKQSPLSEALNRLTEHHSSELWTTISVLDKIEGTGGTVLWQFTPYGALLTHICCEYQGDTDLLYWYAFGPEELSLFERRIILNTIDDLDFIEAGPMYRPPHN